MAVQKRSADLPIVRKRIEGIKAAGNGAGPAAAGAVNEAMDEAVKVFVFITPPDKLNMNMHHVRNNYLLIVKKITVHNQLPAN